MNFFSKFKRNLIYALKRKTKVDQNFLGEEANFDKLFRHYNSDKGSSFIDNDKKFIRGHNFSPYYDKYFNKYRKEKINILEIGVFSGGSSASFANYFEDSKIFCLDFNLSNFKFTSKKFKVFHVNVSDIKSVYDFLKKNKIQKEEKYFDIIIDDASHKLSDQIKTLFFFSKYIKSKGIYVIEDYKFSDLYPHLMDCENEYSIDKILNFLENQKMFKSTLIKQDDILQLIKKLKKINRHKGYHENSDIVFLQMK